MADYRFRHPCPDCGSIAVRCMLTGADEDDRPLRLRRCEECGHRFTTVEVLAPASIYRLDVHRKLRNRMRMRERRGYHGGVSGAKAKPMPRLVVSVSLREPAA